MEIDKPVIRSSIGDKPTEDFFVGETDSAAKIDFDTGWTEVLAGEDLDLANSYEARVLKKNLKYQPNESSCNQLIELCPDDVKLEPDDSTRPANCEIVVLSTDDGSVKTECMDEETDQSETMINLTTPVNLHGIPDHKWSKHSLAGSEVLADVGALFHQYTEPLAKSLIENTDDNLNSNESIHFLKLLLKNTKMTRIGYIQFYHVQFLPEWSHLSANIE